MTHPWSEFCFQTHPASDSEAAKEREREFIKRATAKFIKAGGKITKCDPAWSQAEWQPLRDKTYGHWQKVK